jgi:hypothetical protein
MSSCLWTDLLQLDVINEAGFTKVDSERDETAWLSLRERFQSLLIDEGDVVLTAQLRVRGEMVMDEP